ncbi:hypothetical protein FRC17_002896, partial [Serendipita sp. 399]
MGFGSKVRRNDLATSAFAGCECPRSVTIPPTWNHVQTANQTSLFIPVQTDYSIFAHPSFDANEYANAILAAQPYRISSSVDTSSKIVGTSAGIIDSTASNKEEISVALAKLSFGIEDVNRQLKNVVNIHHEALLAQAASVNQLEGSLQTVNGRLKDISGSVNRLRAKLSTPYVSLSAHVARLQKLQLASSVLRRVARFFMLSRRLEAQMALIDQTSIGGASAAAKNPPLSAKSPIGPGEGEEDGNKQRERAIIKAALSIAEIFALVDADAQLPGVPDKGSQVPENGNALDQVSISLTSLGVISDHLPVVHEAKGRIMNEMEAMMVTGVQELDQSLLSSALLTAHNLRVLPDIVQTLMNDLVEVVESRVKNAFDMAALGRDKSIQEATPTTSASSNLLYKSRVRTEPTNLTAPQWTAVLWTKLEGMVTDLSGDCIKVYSLEKVLNLQKDTLNDRTFLDEAMTLLENKPSSTFWAALARTLERCCRDGSKTSTFLLQTLTSQYPRLLRLFQDFFSRISVHTDTLYTQAYQSPETVLTLRSVSIFESAYLQRSTNRLNELISSSFATSTAAYFGTTSYVSGGYISTVAGGSKPLPGEKDGIAVARIVTNELDTAKFDPLLVKASARGMVKSLEMLCARVDNLAAKDRSSTSLIGPTATLQQHLNASLVNAVYHCWLQLSKLPEAYSEAVAAVLQPAIDALRTSYLKITEPLLSAIRLDTSSIISRVHKLAFSGQNNDPMSHGMGGSSIYVQELAEKLSY